MVGFKTHKFNICSLDKKRPFYTISSTLRLTDSSSYVPMYHAYAIVVGHTYYLPTSSSVAKTKELKFRGCCDYSFQFGPIRLISE